MAEYVKGEDEVLAWYDGTDSYDPLVCLTSHTLSETVDEVVAPRTKCDTDNSLTKEAGDYSYEISFEAVYAKQEADKDSWVDLRTLLRALGSGTWRITTTYADASTDIEYGTGYFSALEKTAETNEFITFSGTITGSGQPTSTDPNA